MKRWEAEARAAGALLAKAENCTAMRADFRVWRRLATSTMSVESIAYVYWMILGNEQDMRQLAFEHRQRAYFFRRFLPWLPAIRALTEQP